MKLTLFRIICGQVYENSLFKGTTEPRDAIIAVLKQQPSGEVREGYTWHVGNLNIISDDYIWFRFGRISDAILPQYDEINKLFIDEESEHAPNALIFLDLHYQVVAIEHNYQLLPNVVRIGKMLERVLNDWLLASLSPVKLEVRELRDLEDIISFINSSYRILTLTFEVGRKNNWDVDTHVQRPHEELLSITNGDVATTEISGSDLNKESAVRVARAVNAKGRVVKIKAMRRPGDKAIKKNSESSHKTIDIDKPKTDEDRIRTFDNIRLEYLNLRNGN